MVSAPQKVNLSSLNGKTVDIINAIRNNGSEQYRNAVPAITSPAGITEVGQALRGTTGLQNEFISALMNRIGLVCVTSATRCPALAKNRSELAPGVTHAHSGATSGHVLSSGPDASRVTLSC